MLPASLSARWMPKDFVESTAAGGVFTLIAYVMMLWLFVLELLAYLGETPASELALDGTIDITKAEMQINFDIDMYGVACKNLQVAVVDPLDDQPMKALSRNYILRNVEFAKDQAGSDRGVSKQVTDADEDLLLEEKRKLESEDGKKELDADWASSHDGFQHQHFDHVIKYHDFTIINFFAGWCSHCRNFAPAWVEISQAINHQNEQPNEYLDSTGHKRVVQALKVNCVDFQKLCKEQGVGAYPTIRLYQSNGHFSEYEGRRDMKGIMGFVLDAVKKTSVNTFIKHHTETQKGCNVVGYILVPRVPGYLELFAGGGDHALDPTMTNVSHFIKHLSFTESQVMGHFHHMFPFGAIKGLPRDQRKFTHPLDNKKFITTEFHQTYEHHISVVSTWSSYGQVYQLSYYNRVATITNKSEVPQARFNYELDTFAIKILDQERKMYSFATSTMAILGGTFVIMKLLSSASRQTAKVVARSVNKNGSRTRTAMNTIMD